MDDTLIKVEKVSKKFCKSLKRSMVYGVTDITKSMVGINSNTNVLRKDEFWALQDVSFELKRGEVLGIIGPNGSGKSTLLKLLNGIYLPDKGQIEINGQVGALIEVGAGFHPQLTGRENVYVNGAILGMRNAEIDKKFNAIVDFADIGDFLDTPVKNYSSGMYVRLGFAIAIHCQPEVLLIDEVLAVGDTRFQSKCLQKIGELKKDGVLILLVSHNMHMISSHCTKICYIDGHSIQYIGNSREAISKYLNQSYSKNAMLPVEKIVTGTDAFRVVNVMIGPTVDSEIHIEQWGSLEVIIEYEAIQDFSDVTLDLVLQAKNIYNKNLFQVTNDAKGEIINISKGKGAICCKVKKININNLDVSLFITLWSDSKQNLLLWWRNIPLLCKGDSLISGILSFETHFTVMQNI